MCSRKNLENDTVPGSPTQSSLDYFSHKLVFNIDIYHSLRYNTAVLEHNNSTILQRKTEDYKMKKAKKFTAFLFALFMVLGMYGAVSASEVTDNKLYNVSFPRSIY